MFNPLTKIFGSSNDRVISKMMKHVNAANDIENLLNSFNQSLNNRGPDNSSYFVSKKNYFGFVNKKSLILSRSKPPCFQHFQFTFLNHYIKE